MKKAKGKKQNKVAIVALAALFTVGIVTGSLAYFSTTSEFKNIFTVGKPAGGMVETFENPSNEQVARGGTFPKSAVAVNTGETPLLARAKITAAWTSTAIPAPTFTNQLAPDTPAAKLMFGAKAAADAADGATADFSVNTFSGFACDVADDTTAKVTKDAKWYYSTDGYFYCKDMLQPKATSTPLLKALSISNTIADATTVYEIKYNNVTDIVLDNGGIGYATSAEAVAAFNTAYGTAHPNTPYTLSSKSVATYKDYAGATLTVTITGDVIQADQAVFDSVKGTTAGQWNLPATFAPQNWSLLA